MKFSKEKLKRNSLNIIISKSETLKNNKCKSLYKKSQKKAYIIQKNSYLNNLCNKKK